MQYTTLKKCIALIAICLFFVPTPAQSAWVGKEGEIWLRWSIETRNAYVYAYVEGLTHGFSGGCNSGLEYLSSKRSYMPNEVQNYLTGCAKTGPIQIAEIDDAAIVRSITLFYRSYPQQRFLNISDVLLKLLAGQSVERIHQEFLQDGGTYAKRNPKVHR